MSVLPQGGVSDLRYFRAVGEAAVRERWGLAHRMGFPLLPDAICRAKDTIALGTLGGLVPYREYRR